MDSAEQVSKSNRRYYQAFESRDFDAMSALWERSDRAVCTHPGWSTLRGWGQVVASYFTLFQNSQHLQFVLTEERVALAGDAAWVSVDENLLGDQGGVTVASLNLFVRGSDGDVPGWRMVCHHGSVVQAAVGSSQRPG